MKITFFCSNCGTRLQIDESLKDKKVRCPNCQAVVGIPPENANKIDEINADSSDSLTQSTFVEEEGFSVPDSSEDFAFDSSISNNPYEPPKTIYYGYQQPDDGMRLTKVFFQSLCSDSISLLVRYYKEILFLCLISFMFVNARMILNNIVDNETIDNISNASIILFSVLFSILLRIVQVLFYFLFVNYLIRLLRTGQTSFHLLKPKKISMLFKGAFASFLYAIEVCLLVFFLTVPAIFIFSLLSRPFLLVSNGSSEILFGIFVVLCSAFFLWIYFMILYRHMFYLPFILDRNAGIFKSFQLSSRYTKGNYKVFIYASICLLLPVIIFAFVTIISMGMSNATNLDLNNLLIISSIQQTFLLSLISAFINSFMMTPICLALYVTMYLQMTGQATIIREASKTKL
ncbi:MAG: hypothetical protein Q4C95_00605 [Planctomycetia bacterium]|nr:hypothetical protein [Planctomycetia bacterium]